MREDPSMGLWRIVNERSRFDSSTRTRRAPSSVKFILWPHQCWARIARSEPGQSKRYVPVLLRGQIGCLPILWDHDFRFVGIGLGEDFPGLPVPGMGKNQARVLQLAQQFRMLPRKEFESPGFVGLDPGHFQDNLGETGDLRIVRLRHLSQANHILFGDVRLFEKPEDIVLILDGLALGLRLGLAALAHMNLVTFAREPLVRPLTPADPAVMSHTDPL
jgi:hypothetical protein